MLVLLYGREGWFAPLIRASGFNIVFAFPGEHAAEQTITIIVKNNNESNSNSNDNGNDNNDENAVLAKRHQVCATCDQACMQLGLSLVLCTSRQLKGCIVTRIKAACCAPNKSGDLRQASL